MDGCVAASTNMHYPLMDASLTMLAQTRNYLMQTAVLFLSTFLLKLRCLQAAHTCLANGWHAHAAPRKRRRISFTYNDGSLHLPRNA
jgi:hypothetical protein